MEPALEAAADNQKRERDREGGPENPPLSDTAGNAKARGKPGACGAGEPAHPKMMLRMDNDARAEKADAGEDALNDAAAGIGNFRMIGGWIGQHHDHGGCKTYQTKRLHADRFVPRIPNEPHHAALKRLSTPPHR